MNNEMLHTDLSLLRGRHGPSVTYDAVFKSIMNPETHPERLESFLCALLGFPVQILSVLPRENSLFAEDGRLIIMDIALELSDRSIVDIEIQKTGYLFSGERSCCYASDFIIRQYNRVKASKQAFSYKSLKPVYIIVLMENSSQNFLNASPAYLHRAQMRFDSNAASNFLQNIIYISLDTFKKTVQNIDNSLDAWLTFLSCYEPERILQLTEKYPQFIDCCHDIIKFRQNKGRSDRMYTDTFAEAERYTAYLTMEDMREQRDRAVKNAEEVTARLNAALAGKDAVLAAKDAEIAALKAQLSKLG